MKHTPVLLDEVIAALQPHTEGKYIDATVGDGGHTQALLEHSKPDGKVLGLDQDETQLEIARNRLNAYSDRVVLVKSRFSNISEVAIKKRFHEVDGVLFDLGISSRQLSEPKYGLNYDDTSPLDMRLSSQLDWSAADFLNRAKEQEIADVLYNYGDRRNSRTMARKIMHYRQKKDLQVAGDVKLALGLSHPAALSPIFQALRIWVNKEFEELTLALPQAVDLLKPGGVLAVISFHSGEDRIVKRFLRSQQAVLELNKRIIRPSYLEIKINSRARSAILRIAKKI